VRGIKPPTPAAAEAAAPVAEGRDIADLSAAADFDTPDTKAAAREALAQERRSTRRRRDACAEGRHPEKLAATTLIHERAR
jgi:hypothetical protein